MLHKKINIVPSKGFKVSEGISHMAHWDLRKPYTPGCMKNGTRKKHSLDFGELSKSLAKILHRVVYVYRT